MDLPIEIQEMMGQMDSTTYNHSVRAWKLALKVEECCQMENDDLSGAALIHDLGKLYIPVRILDKHEGLDKVEREIMELHPYIGYRILEKYRISERIRRLVLYHHGMQPTVIKPLPLYHGEDLTDRARMLHTIDAFEALTTDRPYRRRMSVRQAAEFLEGQEGYHREVIFCLKRYARDFEEIRG